MLNNIELGQYLKKIRESRNLSLRTVERLTGIGYTHLSMIENGKRNVTPALLRNLSNIYNIDYIDLYEKAGYIDLIEDENRKKILTRKFYMCPVYGQIPAGEPNWAEECIEGRLPIDPNMMNIVDPEECYFLRVNGESMNKEIKNGSYALIRKTDWVENGEIAVVLVNGYDATLKKFTKQGDLIILEPMSNDPSFTTQVYNKDTEIKVIGKYIGKMEMK